MKKPALIPIESENDLEMWLGQSDKMLLIFDFHHGWSGACETLTPTWESMLLNYDNSEKRIAFLSMEIPKFASKFDELIVGTAITAMPGGHSSEKIDYHKKGCSPLFLAVRSSKIISTIKGTNAPALTKLVNDNIPAITEDEDSNVQS
mmetsp:Transcript_12277/g.18190  ORF Transcript_12277/g.18190 Transcript_12277/m.18190 type:complete len:148 (-) Transcript_12277:592-1035(-)|eukprot:9684254-Ditylum_brightwellii.AAC.1